jgi:hypothetical protein
VQASDRVGSQIVHEEPPAPQLASVRVWHVPFAQHPAGQLEPLQLLPVQVPCVHICPSPQLGVAPHRHVPSAPQLSATEESHPTHDAPLIPQSLNPRVWQVAPLQHPAGHDVESHTHKPPIQRCPPEHAGPSPQEQAPVALQRLAETESQL